MKDFVYNPPKEPFLTILFEDQDLMVIDKPSGLLCVPGRLKENYDSILSRIWLRHPDAMAVHRLDMDTSGLMVVGLTKRAISALGRMFEKKEVKKRYLAVVEGNTQNCGQIDLPIRCDIENRPLQIVDYEQGKPSLTLYEKTDDFKYGKSIIDVNDTTVLKLTPVTGRSHQLRLHLSSIGHPILGDRFYAGHNVIDKAQRLCLHAYNLEFKHPFKEELLSFSTLPDFLEKKI